MRFFSVLLTSSIIFVISSSSCTGRISDNKVFEKIARCVCKIYIEHELDGGVTKSRGSGIVLKKQIKNTSTYFACTAYHVIEDILRIQNVKSEIFFFDSNGIKCWANIYRENIIWRNREMDSAIIAIPSNISHKKLDENLQIGEPEFVKDIVIPSIGQSVYMMGYRWLRDRDANPIFKKGILSAILDDLPGHVGHHVFLIDKMANKGMSGGLIFSNRGKAIAMISSYLLETEQKIRTSDDITVGIPMIVLLKELETEIDKNGDRILEIILTERQ